MEGNSGLPEITIEPVTATAWGGGAAYAAKAAGKEPSSPGSPPQVAIRFERSGSSKGHAEAVDAVPGWKLDCLCKESGAPPAMRGSFPCF